MPSPDAPDRFPDRLDLPNRLLRLAPTTRAILDSSAFLDGRTPLSPPGARAEIVPIPHRPPVRMRWVWHESFCGSTLLARMVQAGGGACVLREPQVLVDCANAPDAAAIAAVRGLLARRWAADEPVVVKPSNWANIALPELVAPGDRGVTVTIAPDAFIIAVLRGGRERIAYTLRLYDAFARRWPVLAARVAAAGRPAGEPVAVAAAMVAALHWMQRAVIERHGPPVRIAFPGFLDDPAATLATVRDALGLAPGAGDTAGTIATHAKSADRPADRDGEARANAEVRRVHAGAIAGALAFRERLGTAPDRIAPASTPGDPPLETGA